MCTVESTLVVISELFKSTRWFVIQTSVNISKDSGGNWIYFYHLKKLFYIVFSLVGLFDISYTAIWVWKVMTRVNDITSSSLSILCWLCSNPFAGFQENVAFDFPRAKHDITSSSSVSYKKLFQRNWLQSNVFTQLPPWGQTKVAGVERWPLWGASAAARDNMKIYWESRTSLLC